jgi:pimeloyl-ACP methyl ester carboxylesterase
MNSISVDQRSTPVRDIDLEPAAVSISSGDAEHQQDGSWKELELLRLTSVVVGGVRTPILHGGSDQSDEAAVFVHGNPGSSADWQDLMEHVSGFCRCIAPDMPGFGRSERSENFDYTVSGYALHLGSLLEKQHILKAHLVLHDFGGPWGLAWATANLNALKSLTLINTGVLPDYRWHYLAQIWRTPVLGEIFMASTTRLGFQILLKHGNPRGLSKAFVNGMYDNFDAGTKRAVLRLYRATNDPGAMAKEFGSLFRSLSCPTLVIWGRADPYIPVRYADMQREFFASAEVNVLDQSGHWPFADDPEAVATMAVPFLRRATGCVEQINVG